MTRYFADTFFYLALLSPRDETHERAVRLNAKVTGRLVTTQWVLTELADALCSPLNRTLFLELLDVVQEAP